MRHNILIKGGSRIGASHTKANCCCPNPRSLVRVFQNGPNTPVMQVNVLDKRKPFRHTAVAKWPAASRMSPRRLAFKQEKDRQSGRPGRARPKKHDAGDEITRLKTSTANQLEIDGVVKSGG